MFRTIYALAAYESLQKSMYVCADARTRCAMASAIVPRVRAHTWMQNAGFSLILIEFSYKFAHNGISASPLQGESTQESTLFPRARWEHLYDIIFMHTHS